MNRGVLRGLGIALIALPEPFTTPFGAALVAASYLIPRRSGDSRARVRTVVREFAATYRPFGTGALMADREPGKRLVDTERTGLFYLRDVMPPRAIVPVPEAPQPRVRHHRLSDVLEPVQRGVGGVRDTFVGYWGRQQIIRPEPKVVQHTMRWAAVAAN